MTTATVTSSMNTDIKFSPDLNNHRRHNWEVDEITLLFSLPLNDLLFKAQTIHRDHFDPNEVQVSTLLSIKTGACPEDCKYCPQSVHNDTGLEVERLMKVKEVIEEAVAAKAAGASRFCMGAAWKNPRAKDMPYVLEMVKEVKASGVRVELEGHRNAFGTYQSKRGLRKMARVGECCREFNGADRDFTQVRFITFWGFSLRFSAVTSNPARKKSFELRARVVILNRDMVRENREDRA